MNLKKSLIFCCMAVLMLVSGGYAQMDCSQGGMMGEGMNHGMGGRNGSGRGMGMRMGAGTGMRNFLQYRKDLNLTDDQVSSIQKIRMDAAKNAIRRQADIRAARLDLAGALHQANPDYAAARKTMKQISDLQLQGKLAMIDTMEKSYGVLTKEQRDKLAQLMPQGGGMMMGGMSGGAGDYDGEDEGDEE